MDPIRPTERVRREPMLDKMRGTVARGVAVAGLASLLVAVPAFAQETGTQPAEYGQGAGVQRARSLPRTGDRPAAGGLPIQPAIRAAGASLGAAGGVALPPRPTPTPRPPP